MCCLCGGKACGRILSRLSTCCQNSCSRNIIFTFLLFMHIFFIINPQDVRITCRSIHSKSKFELIFVMKKKARLVIIIFLKTYPIEEKKKLTN